MNVNEINDKFNEIESTIKPTLQECDKKLEEVAKLKKGIVEKIAPIPDAVNSAIGEIEINEGDKAAVNQFAYRCKKLNEILREYVSLDPKKLADIAKQIEAKGAEAKKKSSSNGKHHHHTNSSNSSKVGTSEKGKNGQSTEVRSANLLKAAQQFAAAEQKKITDIGTQINGLEGTIKDAKETAADFDKLKNHLKDSRKQHSYFGDNLSKEYGKVTSAKPDLLSTISSAEASIFGEGNAFIDDKEHKKNYDNLIKSVEKIISKWKKDKKAELDDEIRKLESEIKSMSKGNERTNFESSVKKLKDEAKKIK